MDRASDIGGQPQVQQTSTTTHYLRSTALGGKVVAELDQTGYKRKGYIYAGGMQIATQDIWNPGYGSQVTWETTSPATGSIYLSDSAHNVIRKELDPLGADVNTTSEPAPVEPPFYNPKFDQMPLEYEGGPSQEARDAMSWWEGQLAITEQAIRDRDDAQAAWQAGNRSGAEAILHSNPNVGVQTGDGKSYFGNDAAEILYGPDSSNSDEGTHDLTSAYHVNVLGGAQFFQESFPGAYSRIKFLRAGGTYSENGQQKILATIVGIAESEECSKAFASAGLNSVKGLIQSGIVIGPSSLLMDPENNSSSGITEVARQRNLGAVGSTAAQAFTIRDIMDDSRVGVQTSDGKPASS